MKTAGQLVSQRVITGFPEQRLAYVAHEIQRVGAQYCAVLEPRTVQLLGIVRFSNVVAHASTATRIFADLMEDPPLHQVRENDSAEVVSRVFEQVEPEEITVLSASGEYVGLITRESFSAWLIESERRRKQELQATLEEARAAAEFVEEKARSRIAALRAKLEEFENLCMEITLEFQGPLQAVLGLSDAVLSGAAGDLPPAGFEAVRKIQADAVSLKGVADRLVERARTTMEDKWRTFAQVDLNEIVAQALDFLDGQIQLRKACVVCATRLPVIDGHYVPLLQAVISAIQRALHDAPDGAAPSLEIWCEEADDGPVLLVRDNAAGATPDAPPSPLGGDAPPSFTEGDLGFQPARPPAARSSFPPSASHVHRCPLGRLVAPRASGTPGAGRSSP